MKRKEWGPRGRGRLPTTTAQTTLRASETQATRFIPANSCRRSLEKVYFQSVPCQNGDTFEQKREPDASRTTVSGAVFEQIRCGLDGPCYAAGARVRPCSLATNNHVKIVHPRRSQRTIYMSPSTHTFAVPLAAYILTRPVPDVSSNVFA